MPDIQMRFGKDVLVLSTSFSAFFKQHGFSKSDYEYVALCEPEVIEQEYQLEALVKTPCFCTATEGITAARLAHSKFDGQAVEMAKTAYRCAAAFNPQHIIATIGPTGLPLDITSVTSLKASRKQYQDAVGALITQNFDALYFVGFDNAYDAQCALMGARAVYDGPVFLSYALSDTGTLKSRSHELAAAVSLADEYGADVIGFTSGARPEALKAVVEVFKENTDKPLLAELVVRELIERALNPDQDNPYYSPQPMVEAGLMLRLCGVEFLRASGMAMPSYTGALVAATDGLDVVNR